MTKLQEVKPQYPEAPVDEKILAKTQVMHAPQPALTAAIGGSAGGTYNSTAANLINNSAQRILDLENALKKLGLIK
jgi:hypothetical protein